MQASNNTNKRILSLDYLLLCACVLSGALLCFGLFAVGKYALSPSAAMSPGSFTFYSDLLTREGAAHTLYDFQAGDTITLTLYNYDPKGADKYTEQPIAYSVLVNGTSLSDASGGKIPGDAAGFAVETLAISAQDIITDSSGNRTVTLACKSTTPYEETLWATFTLIPPAKGYRVLPLAYESGRYILTIAANQDLTLRFTTPPGLSLDPSGSVLSSPFSITGGESLDICFIQTGYLSGELSIDSFDVRESGE